MDNKILEELLSNFTTDINEAVDKQTKEVAGTMVKALNYLGLKYSVKEITSKITGGSFTNGGTLFSLGKYDKDGVLKRLGFDIHVQFSINPEKEEWKVVMTDKKMKFNKTVEFKNGKWGMKL